MRSLLRWPSAVSQVWPHECHGVDVAVRPAYQGGHGLAVYDRVGAHRAASQGFATPWRGWMDFRDMLAPIRKIALSFPEVFKAGNSTLWYIEDSRAWSDPWLADEAPSAHVHDD